MEYLADGTERKPLYFEGDPDLFSRAKALFAQTSRLRVRYSTPDPDHHALRLDADCQHRVVHRSACSRKVA